MRLSETRALGRLAARTARRQWKRTALIVAIIALPVAVSQVAAGMIAAGRVTADEYRIRDMGAADLKVLAFAGTPEIEAWVSAELAALAPGAELLRYRNVYGGLRGDEGTIGYGEVTDLDPTRPIAQGRFALTDGRLPTDVGEVAISDAIGLITGASIGDDVTMSFRGMSVDYDGAGGVVGSPDTPGRTGSFRVVGTVRDVLFRSAAITVVSPAGMDLVAAIPGLHVETQWLVGDPDAARVGDALATSWARVRPQFLPDPAVWPRPQSLADLWDDVYLQLTAEQIASLDEFARTHSSWEVEEAAFAMIGNRGVAFPEVWTLSANDFYWGSGEGVLEEPAILGSAIAALLMAEVALVAGAAYATGIRRRLRELGLMSVNGATTQHLKWTVIGEGAFAGVLGATIGTAIAAVAMSAGQPIMQRFVERLIIGFPLGVVGMAGPAVVGASAAIVAAWVPARTAARVPATTALQGRMPTSPPPRWVVPLGLGVAGFGAFLLTVARTAHSTSGAAQAVFGVVLMIGGFALLSGPMVAFVGRRADRFRATTRLMLRDSARQRTKAATAVAATMVVLAAPVVLGAAIRTEEARMQIWGLSGDPAHVFVTNEYDADPDSSGPSSEQIAAVVSVTPEAQRIDVTVYEGQARVVVEDAPGLGAPPGQPFVGGVAYEPQAFGIGRLAGGVLAAFDAADLEAGRPVVLGTRRREVEVVVGERVLAADEVPAHVVRWSSFPRLLIPDSVARDLGLDVEQEAVLLVNPAPLTERQRVEISQLGLATAMEWHRGLSPDQILLIGGGVALVVVLLIVGLVTALSATESDHDLRTMVAVGAPPRMRRAFLGLQATYYTVFAAGLAVPLALLLMKVASGTGFADVGPFGSIPPGHIVVPWSMILAVLVAIPLVVGGLTAITVRSAPTMPPHRIG